MLSGVLKSEDDFGGASCKWFLVAFLLKYGSSRELEKTISTIAKELGFSKSLVSKALDSLVKCGFLHRRSSRTGRGRPSGIYSATERLIKLTAQEHCALNLVSMLNSILLVYSGFFNCSGVRFGAASKLLFSVLICHSDQQGIVGNVGASSLCKQAGMSVEQLRKQIDRLVLFGVIRSVVKGGQGKYLFGRVENLYVLNLHSDVFSGVIPSSMTIAFNLQGEHHGGESYEIEKLGSGLAKAVQMDKRFRNLSRSTYLDHFFLPNLDLLLSEERPFISSSPKEARSADQIVGVDYLPISSWSEGLQAGGAHLSFIWLMQERAPLFARLQLLIDVCASMLLSDGWDCFSRAKSDPDSACEAELAVYQKIQNELFSPQVLRGEASGIPLIESQRDDLVCFIFLMSRQSARRVHRFLQDTEIKDLSSYAYRILPLPRPHDIRYGWVLEAVPKAGKTVPSVERLFDLKHGVKVVKSATPSISVLPQKELIRLGLRSRSKRSG